MEHVDSLGPSTSFVDLSVTRRYMSARELDGADPTHLLDLFECAVSYSLANSSGRRVKTTSKSPQSAG